MNYCDSRAQRAGRVTAQVPCVRGRCEVRSTKVWQVPFEKRKRKDDKKKIYSVVLIILQRVIFIVTLKIIMKGEQKLHDFT